MKQSTVGPSRWRGVDNRRGGGGAGGSFVDAKPQPSSMAFFTFLTYIQHVFGTKNLFEAQQENP